MIILINGFVDGFMKCPEMAGLIWDQDDVLKYPLLSKEVSGKVRNCLSELF